MNGFETITRLGGYILLFSILTGCIRYYRPFPALIQYILLGITEITTGLSLFASADIPWTLRCVLSVTATGFGGGCVFLPSIIQQGASRARWKTTFFGECGDGSCNIREFTV